MTCVNSWSIQQMNCLKEAVELKCSHTIGRIMLVEEHSLIRDGLKEVLGFAPSESVVVGQAGAVGWLRWRPPIV